MLYMLHKWRHLYLNILSTFITMLIILVLVVNYRPVCHLFTIKFGFVCSNGDLSNTTLAFNYCDSLSVQVFTTYDVHHTISSVKTKASQSCSRKNYILFSNSLLTDIFNALLKQGYFPTIWKVCYVTPLQKQCDISNIDNYRPISQPSLLVKIYDSLICDKINPFQIKFIID